MTISSASEKPANTGSQGFSSPSSPSPSITSQNRVCIPAPSATSATAPPPLDDLASDVTLAGETDEGMRTPGRIALLAPRLDLSIVRPPSSPFNGSRSRPELGLLPSSERSRSGGDRVLTTRKWTVSGLDEYALPEVAADGGARRS